MICVRGFFAALLAAALVAFCVSAAPLKDRRALVREMVEPVAALYVTGRDSAGGTGVVVRRDAERIYIVTAAHVVEHARPAAHQPSAVLPLIAPQQHLLVTIERVLPRYDLALVVATLPEDYPPVPTAELCAYVPEMGEEVWSVGAGTGLLPFPTLGVVGASHEFTFDRGDGPILAILHSASITFGNSGGPLYAVRDGVPCVAGINSGVRAVFVDGFVVMPIPHVALAVAASVVRDQL